MGVKEFMSLRFKDYLNIETPAVEATEKITEKEVKTGTNDNAETVLRKNNYKIKLVTPTKFGTQIDFAKSYDESDVKDLLHNFKIKFDGKSIFIVN